MSDAKDADLLNIFPAEVFPDISYFFFVYRLYGYAAVVNITLDKAGIFSCI